MSSIHKLSLKTAAASSIKFCLGNVEQTEGVVLAGDVGGTKTNLAIFKVLGGVLEPILVKSYVTKNYNSFFELFREFQKEDCPHIDSLCLGVAGPVMNGRVSGTNFSWEVDEKEIREKLGIEKVAVINDLEANAYGLAMLEKDDFEVLKNGTLLPGNAGIISPGTGLGEAGLYWHGKHYYPFPAEGGHCDFSPRNELDVELWRFLQADFGRVSWKGLFPDGEFTISTGF